MQDFYILLKNVRKEKLYIKDFQTFQLRLKVHPFYVTIHTTGYSLKAFVLIAHFYKKYQF